jgi:hypothetical protein
VIWASQVPASTTQKKPLTQSLVLVQVVAQAVAFRQAKLSLQALWVPAAQVPEPLQVPADVSVLSLHEAAPHEVPEAGKVQAPVSSQPVAPQVGSPVEQAVVQQLPDPSVPQTLDWHIASLVHWLPAASRPPVVPALAVPVVPPVLVPLPEEPPHAAPKSVRPTAAERKTRM